MLGKTNIGIVVDNTYIDDVRVLNQTDYLAKQGFLITIYCYKPSHRPKTLHENITIDPIPSNKFFVKKIKPLMNTIPFFEWWWIYNLKRKIGNSKISILHVHDLYMAKIGKRAIDKNDCKMVLDLHENYPSAILAYRWAIKGLNRFVVQAHLWKEKEEEYLKYADHIIVLSEEFKTTLTSRYNTIKPVSFTPIPNVPNLSREKLSSSPIPDIFNEDDFVMCYFGVISRRRGLDKIIEAQKKIMIENPNINLKLLVIGPIDQKEKQYFMGLFQDSANKTNIKYIEWIHLDALELYLKQVDLCLSPLEKNDQHESGVANKVFQYMRYEKALLVSDCGPQKKLVEQAKCGWHYKWDDQNDLIDQLISILSKKNELTKLGQNGYNYLLSNYNFDKIGKSLLKIYTELINEK